MFRRLFGRGRVAPRLITTVSLAILVASMVVPDVTLASAGVTNSQSGTAAQTGDGGASAWSELPASRLPIYCTAMRLTFSSRPSAATR